MRIAVTRLPRDRVAALRPEDVQQYLRSRGWLLDSSGTSDKAVVYHYPGQADAEVLVPRQRELTDYAARLGDVVQVLSALEERTVWEVINDVSGPPADILRLTVSTANAALGSLPLNEGIKLIEGGRSLLLAAACSVHSPQPFYPRQAFREAVEFLDTCRLGQTERGSFVATIVTPVPPAVEQPACLPGMEGRLEAAEPFPRRVTMRLMQGLGHISQSLDTEIPERTLAGVPYGVSANMCEALASMKPIGEQSQLRIRMSWSDYPTNEPTMDGTASAILIDQATRQVSSVALASPVPLQLPGSHFRKKYARINGEIPSELADVVLADLATPGQDVANR